MKIKLLTAFLLVGLISACTNQEDFNTGKRMLELQGYSNVKSIGYTPLCCGTDDTYQNGFTATDKNGNVVTGCICSGILKGVTIRFK